MGVVSSRTHSRRGHTSRRPDRPRLASGATRPTEGEVSPPGAVVSAKAGEPLADSAVTLRARLRLTQPEFARLVPVSVRLLASLEKGAAPSDVVARRLVELRRLVDALAEVIRVDALGSWLKTPNSAFTGLKPLEVIERGESDRLWSMVFFLRSGVAS